MAQSEVFNIKAIADFSQPEKEVQRLRGKLDREINSAFRNMEKSFGQPLGHITGRVDDFASSLEASNARVIAFGASAGIVYQVSKAFRELVRSTIQVEKSMADIQVVLNANVKQLENYRSGIFRIAKETGQSFTEVSKAATELARQGLSAEKTLVRLKDALVLSRLSGMDTLDSVEALTAAINGFGETVIDSTRLVNKFAEVDQKFAVSSQDLAEAFKRVGSTAVDAGVSIDELIALVTTAQQITARGGSVIGNSFKTIFTRVQRPQVLEDLENAGIKVRDFAGESLKAVDILRNLANGYDKLASSQKSFVSEAVGGVFQINVLKALLKDIDGEFSIFARALDSSANASDAAAKKNEMLNKTLDSLINKSTENLREFAVTLGELTVKPVIVKTLTAINAVVEYIINNKEEFAGVFDLIGKFVSGPVFGLVIGSMIRLFAGFSKFAISAAAQIAGLTKRQEDVARIQNMISNILISQPELYQRIVTGAISVQQAERETLTILRQQAAERNKMMNFASGAAAHAFASGARVNTRRKNVSFPNFADPIRQAVDREVGSGIPRSAIRIAVDNRLKSPNNPQGLGVYNTIDEPLGISQGINRSRQMGIDPRTHGIPNFASSKKRIYNPETGKYEEFLIDFKTGVIKSAKTGEIIGSTSYIPEPDTRKGKPRDRYQEIQNKTNEQQRRENIKREAIERTKRSLQEQQRIKNIEETARQIDEMSLYSKGLKKDPLMLPFSTSSNIPYSSSAFGSVGGLAPSKGKGRDRFAEYIKNLPAINLPESITQFNESQRIAEVAKKTAEDLAKANKDSIARMEKILSAAQSQEAMLAGTPLTPSINALAGLPPSAVPSRRLYSKTRGSYGEIPIIGGAGPQSGLVVVPQGGMGGMQGPMLPSQIITSGPSAEEKRLRDARIKAEKEVIATRKRFSTAETGLSDRDVESGRIAVRMRSMAKEFAKEFQKVLTDPKVSRFEKQVMADVFTKELDKGRFVSTSRVIDALGEQYALKGIMSPFRGRTMSFTEDMKQSVKRTISEEIGGPTSVISGQGMMRFGKGAELLTSKYRLGARNVTPPSFEELLTNPSFLNQGSYTAGRVEDIAKGDKATLIRQIRKMYPNESVLGASKIAEAFLKGDTTVIEDYGKYLRDKGVSPAIQGGQKNVRLLQAERPSSAAKFGMGARVDLSKNVRFSDPTLQKQRESEAKVDTASNPKVTSRALRGLRDMDPMNKLALLGIIGYGTSAVQMGYESIVKGDTRLSETEKNNRMLLSGAAGNILTGAMMGGMLTAGTPMSMMGGALIGGAVAGIYSVYKAMKEWDNILPQLEKNLSESSNKLNQFGGTVQTLMSSFFEFENVKNIENPMDRQKAIKNYYQSISNAIADPNLSTKSKQEILSLSKDLESPIENRMRSLEKILREPQKRLEQREALDEFFRSFESVSQGKEKNLSMGAFQNVRSGQTNISGRLTSASYKDLKNISSIFYSTMRDILEMERIAASVTDEEAIRGSKIPNILTSVSSGLESLGLDTASKDFKNFIDRVRDDLESGGKATTDWSLELIKLIGILRQLTGQTEESTKRIENQIKNFRERDIRFMRDDREFKLSMNQRAYERSRSIGTQNFLKEGQILSNQGVSMLPAMRDIRQLQIGRSTENTIAELNRQGIFDQFSSDVRTQRTKLRDSFFGREMGDQEVYYNQVYDTIVSAIESGGRDSVPSISSFLEDEIKNAESLYIGSGKQAYLTQKGFLEDLQASLQSNKNQIDAVNEALAQNNSLSKTREEMLRKQFDLQYAQGDFLRSQSATRNAERRALEGSDPKTEITSAMRAFREEMGYTVNDFYTDFENSARDAAQTFKSEFKSAFNDFRRGTVDAGEALRQMALNVLDRIATNASNMAIDSLLNAAFGGASRIFSNVQANRTGGMVRKRYAAGGSVTGGSGVVDDVPAMLTSGEYVINRDAVRTYGSDFFKSINDRRGGIGRLENQYLFLDDNGNVSSTPTQGQARISASLSNIGATNDLMRANTDRFAREQRFVSYIQAKRQYDNQRKSAIKQYERGIRQQAIGAGVSAGIGIGASAFGNYMDSRNFTNNAISSYQFSPSTTAPAYGPALPPSQGVIGFRPSNSGSIVPRIGSSNRDTMGYSLTGGEGIVRKEAVNMYGPQLINDLNNGRAKTMRFGSSESASPINEIRNLPSAMDRLSNAISNLQSRSTESGSSQSAGINNNFNFNIEVKTENGQVSVKEDQKPTQSRESGLSAEDNKRIGEAVKIVAQQAIVENIREGGLIYNAIRRR